jgi:hypothetical protein
MTNKITQSNEPVPSPQLRSGERGAALVFALIILLLLGAISISVLAVVSHEMKIAGSDLRRTETYSAAASAIESMTNQFSALFQRTSNPTQAQLDAIVANLPTELTKQGYKFSNASFEKDTDALANMPANPFVEIEKGSLSGLNASVTPYKMKVTAYNSITGAKITLERTINNYLVPLFQFGMFSDKDIELHPGPAFTFNGRIHTNGNLYLNGNVTMLDKVTVANELVYDVLRNNSVRTGASVRMIVGTIPVSLTKGSVFNGPNFPGANPGARGYNPGSPDGSNNATWTSTSDDAAMTGIANQFGGQLLTRSTGASSLQLPLQLGGSSTRELIKRSIAGEAALDPVLSKSRYHTKSEIRIIIDDESMTGDAAGIPAGQGVLLSTFNPQALDGGNALRLVSDGGTYSTGLDWRQGDPARNKAADTVRGIRNDYSVWTSSTSSVNATATEASNTNNNAVPKGPGGGFIPPGAGIKGRILIQVVAPDGAIRDVTKEILSMGMTEGEPNGIVYLQRPLWAAFMQGSRDRDGGNENLEFLTGDPSSRCIADGEINSANFTIDANAGYFNTVANNIDDDIHTSTAPYMPKTSADFMRNDKIPAGSMNRIVPINVYNPREGWIASPQDETSIFERGMTSVIEINMRNLARWVDGVYDNTLLKNTAAVSANIDGNDGYILYISDRRGDRRKTERDRAGKPILMTNGTVDNEDIYGPNGNLDPGEDVIDSGTNLNTLQKDTAELPDPTGGTIWTLASATRRTRAETVQSWTNPTNYFRRAVRIFNGSDLQITGASGKLSTTKGISVATENMVYIWGSYNTTGILAAPPAGTSTLNNGGYLGDQIPSSIVADAIFPLSRTWSDSMSSINPEGGNSGTTMRTADVNVALPSQETSVRAAILAGTNMSALTGTPDAGNAADSRLSGGIHNFPRFLENWLTPQRRWNFVGSFCPLFYSTQALGPWIYLTQQIYGAPTRNWAFDTTFKTPSRLPPGTPQFQFIEATGFRQVF